MAALRCAGAAVVSSMVPFSNAVKYRSIAACLALIWDWSAPASACRSAWPSRCRALPGLAVDQGLVGLLGIDVAVGDVPA
jgi:hypothetical protein